jgi:carboxylesterase
MNDWYQQERFRPFSVLHEGDGDHRTGALLVHGFTGTSDEMRPLAGVLAGLGIDAHAMLQRGMGPDIGQLGEMTAAIWKESAVDRWREHVEQYERTILIGYSMGGAVALLQSAVHPPDLLILLAPHVRMADRRAVALPLIKHVKKELLPFERTDFSDPMTRKWFEQAVPGLDVSDPAVQESLRTGSRMSTAMLDQLRRISAEGERIATSLSVPTVIIQGHQDTVVLPKDTRRLVGKTRNLVAYHEIAGNHMLPFDTFPTWPAVRDLVTRALISGGFASTNAVNPS